MTINFDKKNNENLLPIENQKIKFLIDKYANGNQSKFSEIIGVSRQRISLLFNFDKNRNRYPTASTDLLKTISNKIPEITIDWLTSDHFTNTHKDIDIVNLKSIPMIPVEAMAGLGDLPVSITSDDIKEKYVVPEFTDLKVDFLIRVKGSSMYPKYNSGDIIACKMINESSFIQWNRVHVVHTNTQGALVKRLQKHPDPKLITLASDNPNYPPFEVPRTEITNIALVYGVIRLE